MVMEKSLLPSRKRNRFSVADVVIFMILTILCLTMLYPFLNLFYVSISDMSKITAAGGLLLYPQAVRFDAYKYILTYNNIWHSFLNTVFITLVGTTISLVCTCSGGYALAQRDLPGKGVMTVFVLFTMFFSGGLIPTYLVLKNLSLLNTLWVLILPSAVSAWNLILARNFFYSIPSELSESARIDGASETKILISIVVPLSMPIIATLALFYGLGYWNTYSNAVVYNTRQDLQTLQVIINQLYSAALSTADADELERQKELNIPPAQTVRAAAVIFSTVPILALYPYLQKYFTKGIMVGSLKG